jgi:hypothetical protein
MTSFDYMHISNSKPQNKFKIGSHVTAPHEVEFNCLPVVYMVVIFPKSVEIELLDYRSNLYLGAWIV